MEINYLLIMEKNPCGDIAFSTRGPLCWAGAWQMQDTVNICLINE